MRISVFWYLHEIMWVKWKDSLCLFFVWVMEFDSVIFYLLFTLYTEWFKQGRQKTWFFSAVFVFVLFSVWFHSYLQCVMRLRLWDYYITDDLSDREDLCSKCYELQRRVSMLACGYFGYCTVTVPLCYSSVALLQKKATFRDLHWFKLTAWG